MSDISQRNIDELVQAIRGVSRQEASKVVEERRTTAIGTVSRIANDGVIWVNISGTDGETPVSVSSSEVKEGERVSVTVQNGYASIIGNVSDPSAGSSSVAEVIESVARVATTLETVHTELVEADRVQAKEIEADKADIREITADMLDVREMLADKVDTATLEAETARIDTLETNTADISTIRADSAKVHDLTADQITAATGYIGALAAGNVSAQDIIADKAKLGRLDADQIAADHVVVGTIESDYLKTADMTAEQARVETLLAGKANVTDLSAATARIDDLEADHVSVEDFEAEQANIDNLQTATADIATLRADSAKVHDLTAAQLSAATAYIASLNAGSVSADTLLANVAKVANLTANQLSAAAAYIDALTAGSVTASQLIADHATIDSLDANYAQIDMANVNNAWIQNGTIKDAAIKNEMVADLSANKLTAGTINGSVINVTNLNADNITAGTLNGQRIGEGSLSLSKLEDDVYTEAEVDAKLSTMQSQIDGAIETWTGTAVPTLNNYPATNWKDAETRHNHVGDVYFVVNSSSQQNGYNYRFTESGTGSSATYSWQLIKDSDVTNALQRLTTAEGKIGTIEQFDSDISSWKTDTDEELSSIKAAATTLAGRVDTAEGQIATKVEQSTFNTLSQTVNENKSSIIQLTTTTTELREDLDNIEIGARNLLRHTDSPKANSEYYLVRSAIVDSGIIRITSTTSYAHASSRSRYLDYTEFSEDDYTVSFDARIADAETTYTKVELKAYVGYSDASAWASVFAANLHHIYCRFVLSTELGTEWKRFSFTGNPIADKFSGTLSPIEGCSLRVQFYCEGSTVPIDIRRVKLERGTIATDWSPAPEDVERKPNILRGTNQNIDLYSYANNGNGRWADGTWSVASGNAGTGNAEVVEILDGPDDQLYAFHTWVTTSGNKYASHRNIEDALAPNTQYQVSFYARLTPGVEQESADVQFRLYGMANASSTATSALKTYLVKLTSTEWKFFSYNFTLSDAMFANESKIKTFLIGSCGKGDAQFCGVKLEQSDYVTGWAPSPFDAGAVSKVTTVSNKVSEITQTIDGIDTRIGSLETTIQTKADGSTVETISNKLNSVSDTVDGHTQTISSVESTLETIGGRNLLQSKVITDAGLDGSTKHFEETPLGLRSHFSHALGKYLWNEFEENTQYTFSVTAFPNELIEGIATSNGPIFYFSYSDGTSSQMGFTYGEQITPVRKSMTSTAGKTVTELTASYGRSNCIWTYQDLMLEKGIRATDWAPAPEDASADTAAVESRVSMAESTIEQHTSSIALKANSSDVYTKSESIQLVQPNLTPFFSSHNTDGTYPKGDADGYWQPSNDKAYNRSCFTALEDGWAHLEACNVVQKEFVPPRVDSLKSGDKVTMLVEWRNGSLTGNGPNFYTRNYANNVQLNTNWYFMKGAIAAEGTVYHVFTVNSTADGLQAWNGLIDVTFTSASSATWTGDIRISFYEGEYEGPYKPYVGEQLYATTTELNEAKSEIKVTTDGITSTVEKISSAKYLESAISAGASLSAIRGYASSSSQQFTVVSNADVRVGDTIYLRYKDSTRNCYVYIKGTVLSLSGTDKVTLECHGYEDILPVDTIKSTINQSSDSVKIQAKHIEIDGAAIFSNADFKAAADAAYDAKGSADTAKSEAISAAAVDATNKANAVQTNLDNLEIGGRNLLLGTAEQYERTTNYYAPYPISDVVPLLDPTDILTLSFEAKASQSRWIDVYWSNTTAQTGGTSYNNDNNFYEAFQLSTEWTRYVFTAAAGVNIADAKSMRFRQSSSKHGNSAAGPTIYLRNVKLEKGNKATDWTPAPEDTDAAINTRAQKSDAVSEEQYIYRSAASGTSSMTQYTTWVTGNTDVQNAWTTKRPTYDSGYPVLFVAKQRKTVSGDVTCTTPVKDDTTTVIDGGHITTGTIDAARIDASQLRIGYSQVDNTPTIPSKVSDLTNDSGFQTQSEVNAAIDNLEIGGRNLIVQATRRLGRCQNNTDDPYTNADGANHWQTAPITVTPGSTYTLSVRDWIDEGAKYIALNFLTEDATWISRPVQQQWAETYENYDWVVTAPENASYARVSAPKEIFESTLKLEKGTKATDWTPAPEDVDAQIEARKAIYGTCSTAAGTAAKVVECDNFELITGARITVKFSTANTAAVPTLNVNDTGAKTIRFNNAAAAASNPVLWGVSAVLNFIYDGSVWILDEKPPTYSVACSTAAATRAKAATCTGALVVSGTTVQVLFSTANTYTAASVQFNLSGTGAANVYRDRAVTSTTNTLTWPANTVLTFVRSAQYWYLADNGTRTMSEDAAKTATNYITADESGIKIHMTGQEDSTYQHQTADSTTFYVGGKRRSRVSATGLQVYVDTGNDDDEVANFGTTARIGKASGSRFHMNADSLQAYDSNNTKYFEVTANGLSFGDISAADAAEVADINESLEHINNTIDENQTSLTASVELISSDLESAENNLRNEIAVAGKANQYIYATEEGLIIGENGGDTRQLLTSSANEFQYNEVTVASIGVDERGEGALLIDNASVNNTLYFGDFVWVKRSNGNISLKFIGGES